MFTTETYVAHYPDPVLAEGFAVPLSPHRLKTLVSSLIVNKNNANVSFAQVLGACTA